MNPTSIAAHPALTSAALLTFFAVLFMRQPLKLDYLYAGICLMGGVYFTVRG